MSDIGDSPLPNSAAVGVEYTPPAETETDEPQPEPEPQPQPGTESGPQPAAQG